MDGIIWFMEQVVAEEDMEDVEVLQEMDSGLALVAEEVEDMELMEVMVVVAEVEAVDLAVLEEMAIMYMVEAEVDMD